MYEEKQRFIAPMMCKRKVHLGSMGNLIELIDKEGNVFQWITKTEDGAVTFLKKGKVTKIKATYKYTFQEIHYIERVVILAES